MTTERLVLVADIGKSRCRVELRAVTEDSSSVIGSAGAAGFAGLGIADGAAAAFRLIADAAGQLEAGAAGAPGVPGPLAGRLSGVGAAVAGVEASAPQSRELAGLLALHFQAPAAVLSDATAAHLGALDGGPGTILIVGTGAVAFRFERDPDDEFERPGALHRGDGWGPLLGDRGSGRWIGQQGLSAALEAYDGGPATSLERLAGEHLASAVAGSIPAGSAAAAPGQAGSDAPAELPPLTGLPGWLASQENPYRAMAGFTPVVLAQAEGGDAVAGGIIGEACLHLTRTVSRAIGQSSLRHVALLGGVVDSPYFAGRLAADLKKAGIDVVPAVGNGLAGAELATTGHNLLQERYIHRDGTP
ncbi:ATPase [Pseudarthrobacter sp. J75]|uniref:N-acetylglucosamine kinase n=1 Tax=unclassified Pseudarthrobacter TaxID=2647000 RepID=UPI002E8049F8|nr:MULTISPECIES: ATPase [unclassified Pseudarthrobacter]MEE2524549.1 ATPase [Pseudarthrobacter sp. J47]MEE2527622.1 ATPase [Pseudarthrobacter sp. J75]